MQLGHDHMSIQSKKLTFSAEFQIIAELVSNKKLTVAARVGSTEFWTELMNILLRLVLSGQDPSLQSKNWIGNLLKMNYFEFSFRENEILLQNFVWQQLGSSNKWSDACPAKSRRFGWHDFLWIQKLILTLNKFILDQWLTELGLGSIKLVTLYPNHVAFPKMRFKIWGFLRFHLWFNHRTRLRKLNWNQGKNTFKPNHLHT